MSLGSVKPVTPDLATQMSQAWVEPADNDSEDKDNQNKGDTSKDGAQDKEKKALDNQPKKAKKAPLKDAHRILQKAVEAEVKKVNILDETGKKIEPDVSGMVINILT